MSRERIRPRPRAGSLADQVLALASAELDEHGRPLGATSSAELRVWVEDLAEVVRSYPVREIERPLVVHVEPGALESAVRNVCTGGDPDRDIADEITACELAQLAEERISDLEGALMVARTDAASERARATRLEAVLAAIRYALERSPGGAREYDTTDAIVEQVRTLSRVAFAALFPQHPELDAIGAQIAAREAQLVDLLALELMVVKAYQTAGVLPPGEPPSTAELVARMRGAT